MHGPMNVKLEYPVNVASE